MWLGLAYAGVLMLLLYLSGFEISESMPLILFTQLISAILGSGARLDIIIVRRSSIIEVLSIGVASILALLSAQFIGVYLSDDLRVLGVGVLLITAGAVNSLTFRERSIEGFGGVYIYPLFSGFTAGFVKGVLGAGITPLLIMFQRVLGRGFDDVVFRVLSSEILVILFAFIPYLLFYGLDLFKLLPISLSVLASVYVFRFLGSTPISKRSRLISTISMISLGVWLIAIQLYVSISR